MNLINLALLKFITMQKALLSFISLLFFIIATHSPLFSQRNIPDKQLIATLEEGESFVYGESCFTLTASKTQVHFITRKGKKFFIHDNGTRKGPYDELTEEMIQACNNPNPLCAKFNTADCLGFEYYDKYVKADENSAMMITVNGRSMGPYLAVMQFAITCDETKFAALVMEQDQSVHFIHSSGKNLVINGTPQWLLLSPDGEQALAAFGKTIDPENIDLNTINIADFTSFRVMDLGGTIFGPYPEQVYSGNFWFCKTGGPHWFLSIENQLLRDGKPWMDDFPGYSSCDLWINEDGDNIGVVDYAQGTLKESGKLFLIRYPLEITYFKEGNKSILRWISLEDEKNIIAYKKVL
ncbi:MAG: hypothetical protein AB9842_10840 [Bacteroidales bacterium]